MTKDEFQRRYHNYHALDGMTAWAEANKVNAEGVTDDTVVAVDFGPLGWTLMLASAASFMETIGVIPPQHHD